MNSINSSARRRRTAAFVLTAAAIAAGSMALSPAAHAESFEHSCITNPGAYAAGAVRGVYSTQRVGNDRNEICALYDAHGKHLSDYTKPDYGFYTRRAQLPPGATSPVQ
jgi:hypothetical protein